MNATRLSSGGGNDADGVLSPDGRFVLFLSDRVGSGHRFYRMLVGGSAPPEPLLEGNGRIHSISYPSGMLGFSLDAARDGRDAYVAAVELDGTLADKPIRVAGGAGDQDSPSVSPDGALVAYQSSESGRPEIFVVRLADPSSRRRVTGDGGRAPLWSRDGKRLFYVSNDRVVSIALRSGLDLRFDPPQVVTGSGVSGMVATLDVAADGTSALVGRVADPLMLRRDIRLWPGWGDTLPSVD